MENKQYAGDGVYVENIPDGIILTTENGLGIQSRIFLDMDVWLRVLDIAKSWGKHDGTCFVIHPSQRL